MDRLTRRDLLKALAMISAGTVGSAVLGACAPTATPKPAEEEKPAATEAVEEEAEKPEPGAIEATLEIWTYPRTENDAEIVYAPMMEKFHEEYPGIKTEIDVQPWSGRREKLYAAAAAGEPPDIWFATTDTVPAYIEKGVILPLSDKLAPEDIDHYSESELAAASYEGVLYMPLNESEVNGFAYNGALLREVGYDPENTAIETWDDIYTLAEKAKEKGYYVEALSTMSWAEWISTLHEAGGTVYSSDRTQCLMTEEPAVETLKRWVMEYENGWVPLEYAVGNVDEAKGLPDYWLALEQVTNRVEDAACWQDVDAEPQLEFIIGHPRSKDKSLPPISGVVSGQGWAITRQSQNKDAALIWVRWMIQPEQIGMFCNLAGTTPVSKEALQYWKPSDPCVLEHVDRFSSYLFSDQDANTLWQESKVTCGPHFQAAVLGEETVEQALEAIDQELTALLQEKYGA